MNLKRITDAFLKAPCKGYKGGTGMKMQIPGRIRAEKYIISATPKYHLDYLHGHHPHPFITGTYYCPFCGKWHPTTEEGGASSNMERLRSQLEVVKSYDIPENFPRDGIVAVDFNWPDWNEQETEDIISLVNRLSPAQREEYYKFTKDSVCTPYKL